MDENEKNVVFWKRMDGVRKWWWSLDVSELILHS